MGTRVRGHALDFDMCELDELRRRIKKLKKSLKRATGNSWNGEKAERKYKKLREMLKRLSARVSNLENQDYSQEIASLERQLLQVRATIDGINATYQALVVRVGNIENRIDGGYLPTDAEYRAFFQPRIGSMLSVTTDAGTVTGRLTEVGQNYIRLDEADRDFVYIRFDQINTINFIG